MGLKVNTKTDWGEMFDKFATIPEEKAKATGADPKRQEELAKKAKAAAKKPKA